MRPQGVVRARYGQLTITAECRARTPTDPARFHGPLAIVIYRPPHASPAMADEEVTFERVTKVYREESSKKALTRLEHNFYSKLAAYLKGLEARAAEEVAKGPNSPKAMLLQDELRKVLKKRDQVFQYRERKIALLASSKASGGQADISGLATPEAELFDRLVALLKQTREAAFGAAPAPAQAPPPAPPAAEPAPAPKAPEPAPAFQRLAEPPRKIAPPAPKDLVVVHVLEDIPAFAGIDAKYTLRKEDVVTLPRAIAKVLVDRGKVRIVQTPP